MEEDESWEGFHESGCGEMGISPRLLYAGRTEKSVGIRAKIRYIESMVKPTRQCRFIGSLSNRENSDFIEHRTDC